ncbi:CynX/NimT family MFS transporter [Rhodococcoides corynebacterioides]|uniref:CynX/NimT family MFS transporter n=1 Tax=Rhodococcoides corynebacterioides TaxID=53972 RepID=UPI0027DEAD49|nr:MFS transporter [Rhodococcus corynebacterioides]
MSSPTSTAPRPAPLPLIRGRVLVFAAIVLSAFTLRSAVTSISPLFPRIGDDLGFGAGIIGVLGMVPTLMFAVFGVAAPAIAVRFGLERTALVAALVTAVGIFARSYAPGTASLVLLSAVALAGMGVGNVVIPPLVKRYFSDRVAVMSTVYICFLQFGTIVPSLTAVPVADALGWRASLALWGLAAVAAAVPWFAVGVIDRRGRTAATATTTTAATTLPEAESSPPEGPRVAPWRTSLGWGMALMFGMTSLVTYSLFAWLPSLLVEAGVSESAGGVAVGVFSALGLAASLVAPWLATRVVDPFPVAVACAVFFLSGFAGLYFSPGHLTLLWVVLVGAGPTTFPLALTLINLRTRTEKGSSALSGFTQGVGYLVACSGPLLFGALHEASGAWTWSFAFLTGAVVVLLVAARAACRPRVLEDVLAARPTP